MNVRDRNGNFRMTIYDKIILNCFIFLFLRLIIDIIYFLIKN